MIRVEVERDKAGICLGAYLTVEGEMAEEVWGHPGEKSEEQLRFSGHLPLSEAFPGVDIQGSRYPVPGADPPLWREYLVRRPYLEESWRIYVEGVSPPQSALVEARFGDPGLAPAFAFQHHQKTRYFTRRHLLFDALRETWPQAKGIILYDPTTRIIEIL